MNDKKTIGERIDKVVNEVSEKAGMAKDKIAAAKENVIGIAQDISKSVKKAANDSSAVVSDLTHKGK
ncbi:MAG: hypothetical protein A2297_02780 [Elusimicrobia bacterium RIFOXYB2_FULL_48_7]|nr:MAG: hypothetical protein A2297_02780 [Elusimicrobia bacterium RIFOXYB2_FULL_48_7]